MIATETSSTIGYRTGPIIVLPLWDAFGYAVFILWGAILYWRPFEVLDATEVWMIGLVRLMLVIGAVVASAAIYLLRRRTRLLLDNYTGPVVAAVLCAVVPVSFLLGPHDAVLLLPSAFVSGIGQVMFMMYWRKRFASFSKAQVSLVMLVVGLGLLVGITAFDNLEGFVLPLGLLSLMAVALACYLLAQRFDPAPCVAQMGNERRDRTSEPKNQQKAMRRNLVLSTSQILFGFSALWITCGPLAQWGAAVLATSVIGAALVVLVCQYLAHSDLEDFLFTWSLPVEGACMLVFSFLGAHLVSAVALAVVFALMFANLFAIETSNNEESLTTKQVRLIELGAMERICTMTGYGIGWACALAAFWFFGGASLGAVACAFLLYLVSTTMERNVLQSGETSQDNRFSTPLEYLEPGTRTNQMERRYKFLAKKYELTPRQTDVFMMLCRGRNNGYIQKELTLSRNTIKSHISAIYGKFEVNSQQELITFVEGYEVEEPEELGSAEKARTDSVS